MAMGVVEPGQTSIIAQGRDDELDGPGSLSPVGTIPASLPGLSKLDHVRRPRSSRSDPLDVSAPQVERVALLGIVGMPVVNGRDAALDVIQDLRHHEARDAQPGEAGSAGATRPR